MDSWRTKDSYDPNVWGDMMDGRIWNELQDHAGNSFFGKAAAQDETWIGLTLNFDS